MHYQPFSRTLQSEIIHFFMRKVILLLALLTVSNVLLYSQKEDIIPIEVIEMESLPTKSISLATIANSYKIIGL